MANELKYSKSLYKALQHIEEERKLIELRRTRKEKLQKINNIRHDKI